MSKLTKIFASTLVISGFLALAATAFALGPYGPAGVRPSTASEAGRSPLRANPRACQAKENAIKQRSLHLTQLVTLMETRFDTIASRVEGFYTSKVVPAGKTVPNYSTLVADIATKKVAVSTTLVVAQNDATGFNCTGNDPKAQLNQFRLDMQAVMGALKNYRVSIKNLIVAVRGGKE